VQKVSQGGALPERLESGFFKRPTATSKIDGSRSAELPDILSDGSEDLVDLEDEVRHDWSGCQPSSPDEQVVAAMSLDQYEAGVDHIRCHIVKRACSRGPRSRSTPDQIHGWDRAYRRETSVFPFLLDLW